MTPEQEEIWTALLEVTSTMDNEEICQLFMNVCGTQILDDCMKSELEVYGIDFGEESEFGDAEDESDEDPFLDVA